jgi:ABC-type uncharacterized transport system fused permease/ATPase subunit
LLTERLKGATIIGIAHRAALADFHSKVMEMKTDGSGKMALIDVARARTV